MTTLAETVELLRDPVLRREFTALPLDRQMAIQEELLGKVIIDPDFQSLMQMDQTRAVNVLDDFRKTMPVPQGMPTPEQEALQRPESAGEGERELSLTGKVIGSLSPVLAQTMQGKGPLDPAVLLEPEMWASGMGTGRFVKSMESRAPALAQERGGKAATEISTELPKQTATEFPPPEPPKAYTRPPSGQLPPELGEQRVSLQATEDVKKAVLENVQALAQTESADKGRRIMHQVVEAMDQGLIEVDRIPSILERSNLTMREFADELLKTYSASGKQLHQLSVMKKKLQAWKAANPEAGESLDILEQKLPEPTLMEKFQDAYQVVDNPRRAIMVGQLMTFIRNAFSQGMRYGVEALDRGLEQYYGGKGKQNALETSLQFWTSLKPKQRADLESILKEFPLQEEILRGNPTGELTQMGRLTRRLNFLNIAQEQFYRNATFDASLRNGLRQAGYDVEAKLNNPSTIPPNILEKAVQDAMEVTFAAAPKPGSWGARGLATWKQFPFPLTTLNPYPKFWANAADFIATHNPLSPLKMLMKDRQGEFIGADPKRKAELLAEGTTGTMMLAGAIALQQLGFRGGKWYQFQIGDQQIDLRAYAPFSTFMFMADLIDAGLKIGVDKLNGKTLKQAIVDEKRYTNQDWLQAVLGINRIAGTGLIITDVIGAGSMDRRADLLAAFVSQYIGSFTVPVRTLKDAVTAFSAEEAKYRDVRDDLLGPAKSNVPWLSQTLPERPSPLQKEIPATEHPLMRQLSGISLQTANTVGTEMGKLGIEIQTVRAATGNPRLDRAIDAETGKRVEAVIKPFVDSPGYQRIKDPAVKRFFLESALSYARTLARNEVLTTHPDLARDVKIDAVPKRVRDLILSLTGFDLESAKSK